MPSPNEVETPALKLPFKFREDGADVVEQDTLDEIHQGVVATLRTPLGHFEDNPGFGLPDQALKKGGADLEEIEEAVIDADPRAETEIERDPEFLESAIDHVKVSVE